MKKQHTTILIVLVIVVIIVCLIGGPYEGFSAPSKAQKHFGNMAFGGMPMQGMKMGHPTGNTMASALASFPQMN